MGALFDQVALMYNQHAISETGRGQTMGNNYRSAAFEQFFHAMLYLTFAFRVYRRCRFIKDENFRIEDQSPGIGQQLPLAERQIYPLFNDISVVSIRKIDNTIMTTGSFCRLDNLIVLYR